MPKAGAYERTLLLRFAVVGFVVTLALAAVAGYLLQRQLVAEALDAAASIAVAQVTTALNPALTGPDLSAPFPAELHGRIDALVESELKQAGIVRVKIWNRDGLVVYSDDESAIGVSEPGNEELAEALAGAVDAHVADTADDENAGERDLGPLLEVYVPLRPAGSPRVEGAYEIYQSAEALQQRIGDIQRTAAFAAFGGFTILFVALFGIMLGAARRLVRHSRENERLAVEIRDAYEHTIEGWARALDLKDHETEGHSRRVTELAVEVAADFGLEGERLADVRRGALLHDIGKMGVPDHILNKPGPLTDEEWVVMKRHTEYAREMLSGVSYLAGSLAIPVHHHERWDGTGYPDGLSGENIPIEARIFAVIDVFDALTNDRPYRAAWAADRAIEHLREGAGGHFDPAAVEAVIAVITRDASSIGTPSHP